MWTKKILESSGMSLISRIIHKLFYFVRNIMLVGISVGIAASFGFHVSVKEPSPDKTVEQYKLSTSEVIN